MHQTRLVQIICLCLLLLIFAGSIYARTGYDWELEELEEEKPERTNRRASSGRLRFYLGLLPLLIALNILVAFAWSNKGYSFWSTFIVSFFISPFMMFFILRFFPEKRFKPSGELSATAIMTGHGFHRKPVFDNHNLSIKNTVTEENSTGLINDEIEMVLVSGGSFSPGADTDENNSINNRITLQSYLIGKYPVTQKLWQAVMENNPSNFKGNNLPVETLSWYEAVNFCNKLSRLSGLAEPYTIQQETEENSLGFTSERIIVKVNKTADGYRLPTEAEWEYAARGGYKSAKTEFAGSDLIVQVGWFDFNSGGHTQPVGKKKANELGLYDMSGNVWEWCWDRYYDQLLTDGSEDSEKEPSKGRVLRGGSWNYGAYRCRVDHRFFRPPDSYDNDMGLRLARNYKG